MNGHVPGFRGNNLGMRLGDLGVAMGEAKLVLLLGETCVKVVEQRLLEADWTVSNMISGLWLLLEVPGES